jgi:hypothetical protein
VAGFLAFINPLYKEVVDLRSEMVSYNQALDNAQALENERDKLVKKYNSIEPADLTRLQKLLPDSVDNIRLILEIEKLASPYGMVLRDIKYESSEKTDSAVSALPQDQLIGSQTESKNYGVWNLEFSTRGTYANFVNFIKDLENNLRMVDISSITFSSNPSLSPSKKQPVDSYQYDFKIRTYWLKN